MVEAAVALGRLARGEGGHLEGTPHLEVAGEEAGLVVVDAVLDADGLDQLPRLAQVVARQAREEMVLHLVRVIGVGVGSGVGGRG